MRHGIVLEDFRAAAKVMHSKFVVHTPVIQSVMLSDLVGSPVYFKCENLQITGSYKIRGVFNYLHNLKKDRLLSLPQALGIMHRAWPMLQNK